MGSLSAPAQALLGSDAVAHVCTSNPDGSPQVSVVWVIVQDDEILFGCHRTSRKARNLAQNPRVILSIEDEERNERGFQRHLVIHGQAAIEDGPDHAVLSRLADKYLGLDRHPLAEDGGAETVMVRVRIDRVAGVGPWASQA